MNASKSTIYSVRNVDKALELLELLADHTEGLSLTQLVTCIDLSKNRTFRVVTTLCERGLVEHDKATGTYRLGICSVTLAHKFLRSANLVTHAHPIMEEIARKHGEAVYMSVIRDDKVVFVDMVDCNQHVKAAPLVGKSFPFSTNASGKVLKALDSRDNLEKMLKKRGRRGAAAPDFDRLESELDEIRTRGVAMDTDALGIGISSVAVAIKDYAGMVVGALTLLGPSFRMLQNRLEQEIVPSLCEYADMLSMKFGYAKASC